MSGENWIERHPHPHPHLVTTMATWELLREAITTATPTPGFSGRFGDVPVYVDECPWNCAAGLTGQETGLTGENLRDSGMAESGGVSDGPQ